MDLSVECGTITTNQLAEIIQNSANRVVIIDSRSFLEYNTAHIVHAVNVCCSKLVKRRLQQDKVLVQDLLSQTCQIDTEHNQEIIVYDQCSTTAALLSQDCFLAVLLKKLGKTFPSVRLLKGGLLEFQSKHASLCESKSTSSTSSQGYKCPPLTSMSQPCMPVANVGPTKILPFMYLGSQQDALSQEIMEKNGINYVLNVSTTCPRPPFISESHFLRVAVMDNHSDKLLPYFSEAFQFLDKVRGASGCVLIHCLAGISRSATTAIAYMMYHQNMPYEDAYKYVKDKRPTISPNFNFLGQLLEYEKILKNERGEQENVSPPLSAPMKKHCAEGAKSPVTPKNARLRFKPFVFSAQSAAPVVVQSPTTALSKLSFSAPSPVLEEPNTPTSAKVSATELTFPQLSTTSLDQLSFIPCFASESREASPGKLTSVSGGDTTTTSIKSPSTGTKRPISSTLTLELSTRHSQGPVVDCALPTGSNNTTATTTSSSGGSEDIIKFRSSGFKAKKQLVRPNSIAFSSYPLFDKPSAEPSAPQSESSQQDYCSMDYSTSSSTSCVLSSGSGTSQPPLLIQSSASVYPQSSRTTASSCFSSNTNTSNTQSNSSTDPSSEPSAVYRSLVTSNSSYAVEMRPKDPEHEAKSVSFEQARKSRSLEDILSADGEEQAVVGGCPSHVRARRQKRLINAAEMFSQSNLGHEASSLRCRGPLEAHHHQSSSSISSSGSRSSLHGSLEIIQVS